MYRILKAFISLAQPQFLYTKVAASPVELAAAILRQVEQGSKLVRVIRALLIRPLAACPIDLQSPIRAALPHSHCLVGRRGQNSMHLLWMVSLINYTMKITREMTISIRLMRRK